MPTLADLRQALDRLEAEAPHAAKTRAAVLRRIEPAAGRPRWTHRSEPLLVAAVGVLVALATVVVLAVRGGDDLARPVGEPTTSLSPLGPPPSATELSWTFDLPHPPAGTAFRRVSIGGDSQMGLLERTDGASFMITVHSPGSFDPATDMPQPRRVTVAGQPGYFGPVQKRPVESLVWPTPDAGWVQLDGFGVLTPDRSANAANPEQVLAEQLFVAPLVQFGQFGSPRLPFRLGWLPSGISVQAAATDATFGSAFFHDAGPATRGVGTISVARVDAHSGSFEVEIDHVVGPDRTALTVGGRSAVVGPASEFDARVLAVDVGDGSAFLVYVGNPGLDRYPAEVMRQIAEEADVSMPMTDPRTWIPAPEAVTA